jgi:hypothetical protein
MPNRPSRYREPRQANSLREYSVKKTLRRLLPIGFTFVLGTTSLQTGGAPITYPDRQENPTPQVTSQVEHKAETQGDSILLQQDTQEDKNEIQEQNKRTQKPQTNVRRVTTSEEENSFDEIAALKKRREQFEAEQRKLREVKQEEKARNTKLIEEYGKGVLWTINTITPEIAKMILHPFKKDRPSLIAKLWQIQEESGIHVVHLLSIALTETHFGTQGVGRPPRHSVGGAGIRYPSEEAAYADIADNIKAYKVDTLEDALYRYSPDATPENRKRRYGQIERYRSAWRHIAQLLEDKRITPKQAQAAITELQDNWRKPLAQIYKHHKIPK